MNLFYSTTKKFLVFLILSLAFTQVKAQTRVLLEGTVIASTDGTPLPGVSILIKTSSGLDPLSVTDGSGKFKVEVPSNSILEFRFISFETKTVSVKGKTKMTVSLEPSSTSLKETVVVGYQKRTKETITGAVSRVTSKEIQDIPTANVEELLQGKVPGLNIQQNTGAPGFRGSAAIRGVSEINVQGSGNEAYLSPQSPLYVVDGVPIDANSSFQYGFETMGPGTSPISLIPPEDIESIDVMKDATATALYGSKGANGVIVITTRQGNSETPIVRYTGSVFFSFPPKLRSTIGGKGERDLRVNEIWESEELNRIYDISRTQFLADSLNPFYNNSTNWQDLYYGVTYNQTHNVQVSGGKQELNYKANLNYYDETGVVKNTGFNRYSLSTNINFRPNDRLDVSGYLSAGLGKKLKGSGNGLTEVGAGTDVSSSLLPAPSFFINVGHFTDALFKDNDARTYDVRAYINASYEIVKNIRLSTNTSYDYTADLEDTYTPALANSEKPLVYGYNGRKSTFYNRSSITYNTIFNSDHSVYLSLFSEMNVENMFNTLINRGNGPNDSYHGPLGFNSFYSGTSGMPENNGYSVLHTMGLAGSFQYDYKKKYVVNLNYRQDGSSYAGENNKWTQNPSVGVRWNFNREEFLDDVSWLDYGDLRFSYGFNIRPTSNIFASEGWYEVGGNYNGVTRISPHLGLLPNPDLKPERVKQYNYGFDLGLFSSRLNVTFDYYTKTVMDMLFQQDLSSSTGYKSTFTNDAAVYDYGYEVSLGIRPFPNESPWNWTINLNFAANKDVLLKLPGEAKAVLSSDGSVVNRVGGRALSNFIYISEGVYRTDDDVPVDPVTGLLYRSGSTGYFHAGDVKIQDVDGDYVWTNRDLQVAGSPTPRVTGGFSSFLTYKQYSLNFSGSFTMRRDLLRNALSSRLANIRDPTGMGTIVDLGDLDYWKASGDVARYPYPFDYLSNTDPYWAEQTLFQEDGSYFKLNSITFGYTFDRELTERFGIRTVRLYSTLTNAFILTNYGGPNPENVSELGRDGLGTYPIARTLTVGVNIEF